MNEPAVRVQGLGKTFRLGDMRGGLGRWASGAVKRIAGRARPLSERFQAIDDLTFEVARGESLGVIGPNGAGKSTLLRLLAGILRPDAGEVSIRGRLTALIEVGAGFHPDLTGRENVFLNGAILGMSRAEIRSKLDAIVDFAGISRFIDVPVKRYSSGMYARLGFSIAAHVEPEVLLVDEVLSVGDAVFRLRCLERMQQLIHDGTALVFVTHNLDQMQTACRRAIVLDSGRAAFDGCAREAVRAYVRATTEAFAARATDVGGTEEPAIHDVDVGVLDENGNVIECVRPDTEVKVRIRFVAKRPVRRLVVELNLRSPTQERIVSFNTGRDEVPFRVDAGRYTMELSIGSLPMAAGHYFWNVRAWDAESGVTLADTPLKFPIFIQEVGWSTGSLSLPHCWTMAAEPRGADRREVERDEGTVAEHVHEAVLLR